MVDGRAFLCGTGWIERAGRFVKDETELAMRGGGVEKNEPVGHFPRDVWLVDDHFAAENAPPAPHLYRFEESDWRVLEPLRSKPADGHWFQVSPWTPGHALVLHTRSKNDELLVELRAYGSGAHPPVPRRTQRAGVPVQTTPSEVRGFADGALPGRHGCARANRDRDLAKPLAPVPRRRVDARHQLFAPFDPCAGPRRHRHRRIEERVGNRSVRGGDP